MIDFTTKGNKRITKVFLAMAIASQVYIIFCGSFVVQYFIPESIYKIHLRMF